MALRVWLPLINDLTNQGISYTTVTNNGATLSTGGKLGKCYSFDGNTNYIALSGTDLFNTFTGSTQPFSIAMWVYHADTTRGVLFGDFNTTASINFNIELTTSHTIRFYWDGNPDYTFSASSVGANTWAHVIITYDGVEVKCYINGIEKNKQTCTLAAKTKSQGVYYLGRDSRTGGTAFNGRMCDVRIFDHCLSLVEIKEISQALVIHYKMDSILNGGGMNWLKNSRTFGEGWGGTGTILTNETFGGFNIKYKDNTSGSSYTDMVTYGQVLTVYPNDIYTVSFYAKGDTAHNINCFFYNNTSGVVQCAKATSSQGTTSTSTDGNITIAVTTEWQKYWITWEFKSTGTEATKSLILGRLAKSVAGTSIAKVKLEKGKVATDWSPNYEQYEEDYSAFEDSSGFGHHMVINRYGPMDPEWIMEGELPWLVYCTLDEDTPRYKYSCKYYGQHDGTFEPGWFPSLAMTDLTISAWIKPKKQASEYGTYGDAEGIGIYTQSTNQANKLTNFYISVNGANKMALRIGTGSGTGIKASTIDEKVGEWHHYAVVASGNVARMFFDGEYVSSITIGNTSCTAWGTSNGFIIGDSGSWEYESQFSDIRLYMTALPDTEIKALYNLAMKVDNTHSAHAFEYEEQTNGTDIQIVKPQVLRKGTFINKEIDEYNYNDTNVKIDSKGVVTLNQFIER